MGYQPVATDELIDGLNSFLDYLEINELKVVDGEVVPR